MTTTPWFEGETRARRSLLIVQQKAKAAPIHGRLRRRPQKDAVPSPNPCQVFARAAHCRFVPFQGPDRLKQRKFAPAPTRSRCLTWVSARNSGDSRDVCSLFVPHTVKFRKTKSRKFSRAPATPFQQERDPSDRRRRCRKQAQQRHHPAARRALRQMES
jgi:hypothetical protein